MMYVICRKYKVNKKVFDVVLEWIPRKKGGRAEPIPIEEMWYASHIGINGERVINGCGWSILCYVYDYLDFEPLKTKAYIRFLNTDSAPVFQKCKRMLYFSYLTLILRQDSTIK